MRATRPRRSPEATVHWMASGLTLLEVLVVFLLASMVGTLLIQGTGFFLGQYDTVKRIGREASSAALQQRWFASTVHAMVPYLAADRRFIGDSASFQGVTMQSLRAPSGLPVAARWSIAAGNAGTAVVYTEEPSPCPRDARGANGNAMQAARGDERDSRLQNARIEPRDRREPGDSHVRTAAGDLGNIACSIGAARFEHAPWTVFESTDPLGFEYAGLDGIWRERWPVEGMWEWIPRQVRLVTSDGRTVWIATFGLYQEPVPNPRLVR